MVYTLELRSAANKRHRELIRVERRRNRIRSGIILTALVLILLAVVL